MRIEIEPSKRVEINANMNMFLLRNDILYAIKHVEYQEVTIPHKTWLWGEYETKKIFVTSMKVESWHTQGQFMGVLTESGIEDILDNYTYNFYRMRKNWLNMKAQIEAFGFDLVEKEKPTVPEVKPVQCPICGKNHEEYHLCEHIPFKQS